MAGLALAPNGNRSAVGSFGREEELAAALLSGGERLANPVHGIVRVGGRCFDKRCQLVQLGLGDLVGPH